ncbi:hypothetical protein COO91_07140 [Nostoc flagelliforme CCNUN1]|uniref:Uncharacterized protein n=1 Tax=Nostoc flagelliforme CCNUN1 TaxID=2038116 RepID=A0A2K8T069_9NOSO|nr:hypothetical protein COO91_07140 [Nostoc flagelliforme CCNUN1]
MLEPRDQFGYPDSTSDSLIFKISGRKPLSLWERHKAS